MIIIDAGHQLNSGARHTNPDGSIIYESHKALAIAKYTKTALMQIFPQTKNIVYMTRKDNETPYTSKQRRTFAGLHASQIKCWVSIHLNSWSTPYAHGAEILRYYKGDIEAEALAQSIAQEYQMLVDVYGKPLFRWRRIKKVTTIDRWGKQAKAYHDAGVVAVLVECGFLSNKKDRAKLLNPTYMPIIGQAIALGIAKYMEAVKP